MTPSRYLADRRNSPRHVLVLKSDPRAIVAESCGHLTVPCFLERGERDRQHLDECGLRQWCQRLLSHVASACTEHQRSSCNTLDVAKAFMCLVLGLPLP
jgi:hypothetical protein